MPNTRREFLATSAGVAAGLAAYPYAAYASWPKAAKPLRILILGGTGFLGPHCVEACLARGHRLTLFNRGRTEKVTGHTFENQDNIQRLYGNRDPDKLAREDEDAGPDNPKGLSALTEGEWDAVIDTSGYWPRIVSASAELLAPRVGQYLFISTVSVYAGFAEVGADTSAPIGQMADPTVEEFGDAFENYGPGKALCEQAAETALPGRATNIRPGLIVGPGDTTGRFTYWPARASRGGEILAPGNPTDPIQLIDVRDLAAFMVHCLEQRTMGVFDALGPTAPELTMGKLLDACRSVTDAESTLTWCDAEFLAAHQVSPWGQMPVWIPPVGDSAGFHQRDITTSIDAGLKFSPVKTTCADTLAWHQGLEPDSRFSRLAGITPEREAEVLQAWREQG